ncbi:hypothetical protein [Bifidobacterium sp. SO1]|uniref:hypothetical protein n=1 Tax=Bifidobacterium sp. SO1 TaxID=2809029 RepID=UPI001BDBFFD1|nr:hypothetical protein [Bifidobacterium sp. SO1]MBT1162224.1 hypothetical protein [Bifidobacterium sp. SO1]
MTHFEDQLIERYPDTADTALISRADHIQGLRSAYTAGVRNLTGDLFDRTCRNYAKKQGYGDWDNMKDADKDMVKSLILAVHEAKIEAIRQ